ncbi:MULTISPECIES: YdcF family protein [Bacillus]|uniref:Cytoplasmic protein n=1 Tax=Bacillus wiedmannii TaxID=1890302 RepID=A0A2A8N3Z6_9BACI|nr:YdcF family protein [Bacillus wiedmannii]KMP91491.1 cytoplasmic protein [Bacillus wiedmannii]MCU5517078.1 YdcF family protein [Bacillus wiedmannii]MCU5705649.1 YdcF family protein [Bacillus wiedmannii]PEI67642.1 cytoplasmic protein [Bacillus wiedmannii]PEJ41647.1 cytoplasmic protein [Bacillus wiedmannii]
MNKWILLIILLLPLLYILYMTFRMKNVAREKLSKHSPYVLILGAKLFGDRPSLSLQNRLDVALEYLYSHPEAKVIVSGGQGEDEDIPEAHSMRNYLMVHGIDENRILMEDQSTNTYENLKFSMDLYDVKHAVVVSNTYHLYRTKIIAKRLGMKMEALAAETPMRSKKKMYVREYVAIMKTILFDR